MNHEGKWYLSCLEKTKPARIAAAINQVTKPAPVYVFDETLVRCDRFSRFGISDLSPAKDPPDALVEVAYAACKKYLQTNGDR